MYENFPEVVTPNVQIGDPVRVSPAFPLQACGNDGLREDSKARLCNKLLGIEPVRLNFIDKVAADRSWQKCLRGSARPTEQIPLFPGGLSDRLL